MICEFCGAELSAGDISVIPDKNGEYRYHVICHGCDKTQSSTVSEVGRVFYVIPADANVRIVPLKGGDTD